MIQTSRWTDELGCCVPGSFSGTSEQSSLSAAKRKQTNVNPSQSGGMQTSAFSLNATPDKNGDSFLSVFEKQKDL